MNLSNRFPTWRCVGKGVQGSVHMAFWYSCLLPSALSVKDTAKLTNKQIVSEISCYRYSENLHCVFSMVTGPECTIRLRRKLLKAHGLYSSTIQADAFESPRAGHCAWNCHLSLKTPAASLSRGWDASWAQTLCSPLVGGTETLRYGNPRSLGWCWA